jgi:hypothetical protein
MGWLGQSPEHQPDHCEADEGCDGAGVALEVACQAAIAADPGEGTLDDPSFWQDDETKHLTKHIIVVNEHDMSRIQHDRRLSALAMTLRCAL